MALAQLSRTSPISELPHLVEQDHEQQLLHQDLEIARQIQESLLPKNFPALPGFQVAASCRSAKQVGGDFYDVVPAGDGAALLVIADAMGKGVAAAMLAASLRTLIRTMAQWTQSPGDLLARVNRLMFEELSNVDMFITAQLALISAKERQLTVASAGHCPLLVIQDSTGIEAVSPEGRPLGISPDAVFVESIVPLEPGAAVLLYTDGVTDARNSAGDYFGQQRLERWLLNHAHSKLPVSSLKEKFLQQLGEFDLGSAPRDDQTFLLLVSCEDPLNSGIVLRFNREVEGKG